MQSENNHNISFDLWKFIFAIFVVIIHTMGNYAGYPIIRISVPMFFLMSGYLYFSHLVNNKNINDWQYYWHYVKRILVLYIAWFIVLLPHLLYTRGWFSNGFVRGLGILTVRFLLNSTFTGSWYLSAVVIGIGILHFITIKLPDWLVFIYCFTIYCLCCAASNYRGLFKEDGLVYFCIYKYPGTFYHSFPVALVWLQIGKMFVNPKFEKTISSYYLSGGVLLSLILLFGEYFFIDKLKCCVDNDCYLMLLPVIFCICALAVWYDWPGKVLSISSENSRLLRNFSTIIYCSHGAYLILISKCLNVLHFNSNIVLFNILKCIGTIILGLITSSLIIWCSHKRWGVMDESTILDVIV